MAFGALQRILQLNGSTSASTAREQSQPAAMSKQDSEMSLSRGVTEDVSASRISQEPSVCHQSTPQQVEDDKRGPLSSDSEACCSPVNSHGGAELISHNVEERLRGFLFAWGAKLVELQPKVHMSEHLIESGLFLFKCLRQLQLNACCEGTVSLADLSNELLLIHDLIACFWIAMKQCSIRTQVPNRTLVSKATGAQPEFLGQRELGALLLLDWDVNTLLRCGGFVV